MINPRHIAHDLIDIAQTAMSEFVFATDRRVKRAKAFLAPTNPEGDVPRNGQEAFYSGWQTQANPHPSFTVEAMRWTAAWWSANADAYEDHINGE